jgi:hypothetical protein
LSYLPSKMRPTLLVWLFAFEATFAGICLAAGSPVERRSHFWLRLVLSCLAVPLLPVLMVVSLVLIGLPDEVAIAVFMVVPLAVIASLMFVPALLYVRSGSPPGPPGGDGGGGSGPDPPPSRPKAPTGGLPLPDAAQARARARDHIRPRLHDGGPRRPAHKPERTPDPAGR